MSSLAANSKCDFLVIGGGIVGLTVARELALRKLGQITVLEKEPVVGAHASGRNSGVLHAGIYYPSGTLKARLCVEGHRLMNEYVEARRLPILKCGKFIVATKKGLTDTIDLLEKRARENHVPIERVSESMLKQREPVAHSFGDALFSPRTAVIDSKAVLKSLVSEITEMGVEIRFARKVSAIDSNQKQVHCGEDKINYGYLINAGGAHADRIAHMMGVGHRFRILPFKGLYWSSSEAFSHQVRSLIYPAPDLTMPFLGVHITKTVEGKVLFGPTAIPAFGRENYSFLGGLEASEAPGIGLSLAQMLVRNPGNFRRYVREEVSRYRPKNFFREAQTLAPSLREQDIAKFAKVGIRAQLMDTVEHKLVTDFILEPGPHSLHVLNAISPAFTSSLAFAKMVADHIGQKPQPSAPGVNLP